MSLISGFTYNQSHSAEATIYSMFKFPEVNKIHFQCDITLCKVNCPHLQCNGDTIKTSSEDSGLSKDSVQLLASTTAFVVEPGSEICRPFNFYQSISYCFVYLQRLHT